MPKLSEDRKLKKNSNREKHTNDILVSLAKFKFLTTNQIAKIYFDAKMPNASMKMQKLHSRGLVDRVRPMVPRGEGTAPYHYSLTRKGRDLVSEILGARVKESRKPREVKDMFMNHRVETNDLVIEFIKAIEGSDCELIEFNLDDSYQKFVLNGKDRFINPDGMVLYHKGDKKVLVFFEHDRGTMEHKTLRKKFQRYSDFFDSEAWKVRTDHLPIVCFSVGAGEQRIENIKKTMRNFFMKVNPKYARTFYIMSFENLEGVGEKSWTNIANEQLSKLI